MNCAALLVTPSTALKFFENTADAVNIAISGSSSKMITIDVVELRVSSMVHNAADDVAKRIN